MPLWNPYAGTAAIAAHTAIADAHHAKTPGALTIAETQVFTGTSPTGWQALDLSSTIGAQVSLVVLKFYNAANQSFGARKNGDTDDFDLGDNYTYAGGAAFGIPGAG
ncbi:unnamed protein product, partial [marine sediment metagenome]